ncbi:hypothetical protein HDA32_004273 [Spinactinospora alkalitolerans]|uniref:Subtilisin inhibitor domain-containing protein n=1 Tax=Spinactinospora alkalitolerans TaxID=687207 RepID=A0A852U2I2_9ACTN|nr:hypothetical protein [Spinactinospora alkalitolerans]NYE49153.1 hypothetical protein [Spinactinospora alkalitolerans]
MSKVNSRRASPGTIGTAVLGTLCLGGAVVYTAVVGASLVSLPTPPSAAEGVHTMSGLSDIPSGPVGSLRIRVDDGEEVYEQSLACTGDPATDPAACGELAARAEEDEEPTPFEEVSPGSICTDMTYGPQTATVVGTWNGAEVETEVSRAGSCEEARWQRLKPLTDRLE